MNLASACGCVKRWGERSDSLMRALVPIGLLAWMVGLFVAHHQIHAGGCVTEARWASQNDEVYDRELEVN